jgi:hypothetical protein
MRAETRIVEQEEVAVSRQLHNKCLSPITNSHATIEELLGHC